MASSPARRRDHEITPRCRPALPGAPRTPGTPRAAAGGVDAEPSRLLHTVTRSLREALSDLQQKALHNSEELLRQETVISDLRRQLAAKSALVEHLSAALMEAEQGRAGPGDAGKAVEVLAAAEAGSHGLGAEVGGAGAEQLGAPSTPRGAHSGEAGPCSPTASNGGSPGVASGIAGASRDTGSSATSGGGHGNETSSDAESSAAALGRMASSASTAWSVERAAPGAPAACEEQLGCMLQRAGRLAACIVSALDAEVRSCDCGGCDGGAKRGAAAASGATTPAATGEEQTQAGPPGDRATAPVSTAVVV
ncbi:hypothetical protein Rsub_10308 [Raphidocelis subcapitata]|uniref:Uncharacterized protein n=1 Tax=Raphidocelis subcapitata TaxID=307507 RepID=A0A2V0PJJ9_9CHLO|nr:hypothetical protein Rsub_10308 [Raphidocelis subcapitata]|eukprot:GBF98080.1 hypothetical protein Rsub_10308 [Raphidocelis subcapitata]